jgi:hypothetical protein
MRPLSDAGPFGPIGPTGPTGPRHGLFRRRRGPRPTLTPGLRRLWRVGGALWVALALPFGTLQVASRLAHEQETVTSSFPAAGLAAVEVHNSNGSATVVGTDSDEVRVTARIDHGWKKTGNHQRVEGDRLLLSSTCPSFVSQFCTVNYVVEMPAHLAARVYSDSGTVTASDITGGAVLHSDNGRVEAARMEGDLELRSSNGRVTGHDLGATGVAADSDNGRVELGFNRPPRAVTARSSNGSVDVVVPDDSTAYRVDAASDNGSATATVDQSRDSANTITALSHNGAVTVRYAE